MMPELSSPVTIRVNDTIREVDFFDTDGKALGKQKANRAKKFWKENYMDERLKSIWFDALITGDGYGWLGFLNNEQIKEVTDQMGTKYAKQSGVGIKEMQDRLFLKSIDEDKREPRMFDYVASSTMIVNYNTTEVTGYTQMVGTDVVKYSTEEIIHFMFQRLDGKVDGFSPIQSLTMEMDLLWFIKNNMVAYSRNGGLPAKIFTMPDEQPNSANQLRVEQSLRDYNAIQARNGNLVLTGKVDVQDMNNAQRDMEYKEMALWVTSNFAYALQVPVQRIPYMIGQSQSGGDSGGLADSGYWSMVETDQRKIETDLNNQVFDKLGVMVRFKKPYKIDGLREAQAMTMKADGITKLQSILAPKGKTLSARKIASMFEMDMDEFEDLKGNEAMSPIQKTGLMNQNLLNNIQMEGDKGVKREGKRTEQLNSASGKANVPGGE